MRTVFTSHGLDSCSIKYWDKLLDLVQTRTFIKNGSYVFELIGSNGYQKQLCKNLSHDGITLIHNDSLDLVDTIKKEYKRFKYKQSKFLGV